MNGPRIVLWSGSFQVVDSGVIPDAPCVWYLPCIGGPDGGFLFDLPWTTSS